MGEITISLCFCRTRTVGFRAGVKVQTVFLAWSTEGVTDAEVKRCMQLKWRSLAFVIQSEESPSGINMHSDARLESRLHKGLFALGSYLCLCGFVAETWMCGAQRSSVVETQAHSMHGSCSSVWTNSSSKQSHFLVFFLPGFCCDWNVFWSSFPTISNETQRVCRWNWWWTLFLLLDWWTVSCYWGTSQSMPAGEVKDLRTGPFMLGMPVERAETQFYCRLVQMLHTSVHCCYWETPEFTFYSCFVLWFCSY